MRRILNLRPAFLYTAWYWIFHSQRLYITAFLYNSFSIFFTHLGERIHLHLLLYSAFRLKPNVYASKINRSDDRRPLSAECVSSNASARHAVVVRQWAEIDWPAYYFCCTGGRIFHRAEIGHSFKTVRFSSVGGGQKHRSPEECRVI